MPKQSLATSMALLLSSIFIVLGAIAFIYIFIEEKDRLVDHSRLYGESVLQTVVKSIQLSEFDSEKIQLLIVSTATEPDINELGIVDHNFIIKNHSIHKEIGKYLIGYGEVKSVNDEIIMIIKDQNQITSGAVIRIVIPFESFKTNQKIRYAFIEIDLENDLNDAYTVLIVKGFFVILIIVFINVIMYLRLNTLVIEPVRSLKRATEQISSGVLSQHGNNTTQKYENEFSDLINSFNKMISDLEKSKQSLIQSGKMNAIGQLSSGIAHEINNPLTTVITYTYLIEKKFKNAPKEIQSKFPDCIEQFKQIIEAAKRCQFIATSLLSFSRQSKLEMKEINVSEIITNTLALLRVQFRHKNVKLIENINSKITIYADANQIQQVLTNLLLNALYFVAEKTGFVILSVYADESNEICIIDITDNGTGISKEDSDKLFDPFFTTKPIGEGTGLGLAIVYGIVKDHNGTIEVLSEPSGGASFQIKLPLVNNS